MKFQKAHRIKLVGYHQNTISKYKRAKLYIKKLEGELKIAKNALRNTPHNSHNVSESLSISTPIFQPNSTPFNMINAEANIHNTPAKMKIKMPDMRHRKQSFRNELSLLSTGSNASEVSTPGSSVYASPMNEICNEKYMPTIDNLQLNSFGHKYLKSNQKDLKNKTN
uniref:Uncharacterized protein n=1 Tax=Schizaphis graminum TaxID=13262 RepID=A0A2S2NLS3_SCHGA